MRCGTGKNRLACELGVAFASPTLLRYSSFPHERNGVRIYEAARREHISETSLLPSECRLSGASSSVPVTPAFSSGGAAADSSVDGSGGGARGHFFSRSAGGPRAAGGGPASQAGSTDETEGARRFFVSILVSSCIRLNKSALGHDAAGLVPCRFFPDRWSHNYPMLPDGPTPLEGSTGVDRVTGRL